MVFGNFLYSQKLKMFASSPINGIFDIELINTTDHEMQIALDTTGINFACKKEDIYNGNFLRVSLCTKIPKNTDYPTGIDFSTEGLEKKNGEYSSREEYLTASTIIIKPKQKKKIRFNIFKQKDAFSKLDKKPSLLKSKIILFKNEINDETIVSNIFKAKIPLKKW